ncbi:hypothetical protein [Paludibacterium purpuratum]|uniref:Uncharacterized protein n=1 Tax=Paludibacterium purpuratum TaxID=1144873 RepID=A0A4V3DVF1_9NEIS|nr:hypothetical protein [Paludibacterium purpuratum]TDR80779.1 hypothetical protein DFP86_104279 [Paludibacterium purpuratum]
MKHSSPWRRWLRTLPDQAPGIRGASLIVLTTLCYSLAYWLLLHDALQTWRREQHASAPQPIDKTQDAAVLATIRWGCDMAQVKDIARRHRLVPLVGEPVDEQAHGALTVASAQLVATGTFDQLQDFAVALSRHPSTLTMDHMQLGASGRQRLDLHARILCLHPSPPEISP